MEFAWKINEGCFYLGLFASSTVSDDLEESFDS